MFTNATCHQHKCSCTQTKLNFVLLSYDDTLFTLETAEILKD